MRALCVFVVSMLAGGCATGYRMKPAAHDSTYREDSAERSWASADASAPTPLADPPHGGGYLVAVTDKGWWESKTVLDENTDVRVWVDAWTHQHYRFKRVGGAWTLEKVY